VSASWRCSSCGGENPPATRFCGHCGAPGAISIPAVSLEPRDRKADDTEQALRNFVHRQVADRLIETGGRLGEERRLVTALFADISGFTPMADRLDPEQLMEVIDPILRRLSSVVDRYEGYIDKFAGDALLAFFGAPVSHEDDAIRALLVALEMHREIEAVLGQLRPEVGDLTLHVGVNTGHVIARVLGSDVRLDYSVLGDAVILAQRLESAAPGGGTYVGEATYRLTAHRFDFESVGELTLKGKAQPVPAWRLKGEREGTRDLDTGGTGLVGRQAELAKIQQALDQVRAGRGGVLSLVGEPGIGKSRLLQAARERAAQWPLRWLDARCLSYGAGLAYWPYADLLRRLCGISRDGLTKNPLFLQRLLGIGIEDETSDLQPEALRRGLHAAVAELVAAFARKNPVVLALEDLHWADLSSLELTADLIRATATFPVLYIVTSRPEGTERVRALLDLRSNDDRLGIALDALDRSGVRELVEIQLGGAPHPGLVDILAERTSGNPFFVEETVRSLVEAGVLTERDGHWMTVPGWQAEHVPPTIEGVIAARLDRLSAADGVTLELGSVIGRTVRRPLLEAVTTDGPELEASLSRLVEAGFLDRSDNDPERSVTFHHALVQSVAYNRMLRKRRRELHLRVANAAEAIYGAGDDFIEVLARHFYLGEGGARAVEYLLRAAQRARRLFANHEAILHLRHAEEVVRARPELGDQLPTILFQRAELLERVGDFSGSFQLYEEVRGLTGDVNAWRGMASTLRKQGKSREALDLLDEAFVAAPAIDARPFWLERSWSLNVSGRLADAAAAARAGLESANEQQDPLAGYLLLQLVRASTAQGRFDEAIEHGIRARRIFEQAEDPIGLATVMRALGAVYSASGQLDQAATTLRQGLTLAERIGSAEEIGGCLINLAQTELFRGNIEDAIAVDLRAIEEFERMGAGSGRATAYANLAEMLVKKGDYPEAERRCQQALRVAEAIGHEATIADVASTRAMIALAQHNFAEAAAQASASASLFERMGAGPQAAAARDLAAQALAHT
jgi:class 3 adenylate cyclase/tetratricopeptide (TPR) repeat protein